MCATQTSSGSRGPLASLDPAGIVAKPTMANAWYLDEASQRGKPKLLPAEIAGGTEAFGNQHLLVTIRNDALPPAEHGMVARKRQNSIFVRPLHRPQELLRYRVPQLGTRRTVDIWRSSGSAMCSDRHVPRAASRGEPIRFTAARRRSAEGCRYGCEDIGLACPINIWISSSSAPESARLLPKACRP